MPDQFVQPNGDFIVKGDVVVKDANGVVRIRLDHETGSFFIHNRDGDIVFHWEMPGNNLRFGGHDRDGDLLIFDKSATNLREDQAIFHLDSQRGVVQVGGNEIAGQLICLDAHGNQTVFLDGTEGNIAVGANGQDGNLFVQNANNLATIHLDGAQGNIIAGSDNQDGDLFITNSGGETVIHLNGQHSRLIIKNNEGNNAIELDTRDVEGPGSDTTLARLKLGGRGSHGRLQMFRADNTQLDFNSATVELDGKSGSLSLGSNVGNVDGQLIVVDSNGRVGFSVTGKGSIDVGDGDSSGTVFISGGSSTGGATDAVAIHGNDARLILGSGAGNGVAGSIDLNDSSGQPTIMLRGSGGGIRAGGNGSDGDLMLFAPGAEGPHEDSDRSSIHLSADQANVRVGGGTGLDGGIAGDIFVCNRDNETTIHLDGQAGDIILQNADCAEDFQLAPGVEASPGDVMVMDAGGKLRPSTKPYDKRVAGVVSGRGELRPGIILGRHVNATNTIPIALVGRTYCKVDATTAPVEVGDLLTTSTTPGMAMKATDLSSGFGSIIGKALQPIATGSGMIPVLVTLQ